MKIVMKKDSNTVDFGHARVERGEKSRLVRKVFSEVSETYDLFNDIASLGLHRIWKKYAIPWSTWEFCYRLTT